VIVFILFLVVVDVVFVGVYNAFENSSIMVKEMVGGCCVCSDERGWDENPLVYCDGHGCNVAVHQGEFYESIVHS
jgi:hypothetical protein